MRTRIPQARAYELRLTLYVGEEATDPAAAPAVTVRNVDGSVRASGVATDDPDEVGVWTFTLTPTDTLLLGEITAEWTANVGGVGGQVFKTYHEVVGDHLFSVGSLRNFEPLDNEVKYPIEKLVEARDLATYAIEEACRTAFTRRRNVELVPDPGKYVSLEFQRDAVVLGANYGIELPYAVYDNELLYLNRGGLLSYAGGPFYGPLRITYEYGWLTAPSRVVRATQMLAREWLQATIDEVLPDRAVSVTNDAGSMRLVTAGEFGRGFDIPEVNAVVQAYSD